MPYSSSMLEAWLSSQGLSRLAPVFAAHHIDFDILATLTEDDFKEMGLSLGERRRLMTSIAGIGTGARFGPLRDSDLVGPGLGGHEGERRQLTVLFCDLVGSTALSRQLDPEEMQTLVKTVQATCGAQVSRFGGNIAQYQGDGALIYFGYPSAHEDDAERAVLAALGIVADIPRLRPHANIALEVRIGIATGLVVVDDLVDLGSRQQAVYGDTPNLAARLQSAALPGTILVSARTHRLTEGLFDCVDLGVLDLKGFEEPVRAWQVRGEKRAASRFDALRATHLVPMVGRQQELGLLLDRWERAQAGEGQVVMISGEPGIGKSRVARALRDRLTDSNQLTLSYVCSPHHQTSALYPIIAEFERACSITNDDTASEKLDKLEALQQRSRAATAATVPVIAALLSITTGDRYPALTLTPEQLKEKTVEVLLARLGELAGERPLLCVFEDVHWIDPTSLELVTKTIGLIKTLPVLLILTARPEFSASALGHHAHMTEVSLNRLTRRQSLAMIDHCADGRTLPADVMEQVFAKADGMPLFIEELTRSVLESSVSAESVLDGGSVPLAVPATLHDSLMARLDRMFSVKQLAQLAAVLGRTFTPSLLAAVARLSPLQIEDSLTQLVQAGLVVRTDRPPRVGYQFKHALLQDVAYQSLLKTTRQQFHERVARTLEDQFPEVAEVQPEVVAHHFTEAGKSPTAIRYWLRAGKRATQRSANLEAISQLNSAIHLIDSLPKDAERSRLEYQVRLALVTPLISAKGYSASEIETNINRALQLSEEIGDTSEIFPILYARHAFESVMGQIDRAVVHAEETMRLAERFPQSDTAAFAGRLLGSSKMFRGDTLAALPLLETTLANYDPERHRSSAFAYGQDHFVVCATYLCLTLWHLGQLERAEQYGQLAISSARQLAHLNTLCLALSLAGGFLKGLSKNSAAVEEIARELVGLTSAHSLPVWSAVAAILQGRALSESDRIAQGIACMEHGISALDGIRISVFSPMFNTWLAEAYGRSGDAEGGLRALDAAQAATEGGEHWMDAELHRLNGELRLILLPRRYDAAERSFHAALAVARTQQSRILELRATASLARLWCDRGKRRDARELLEPIYLRFAEGFSTPDVTTAKVLLAALA